MRWVNQQGPSSESVLPVGVGKECTIQTKSKIKIKIKTMIKSTIKTMTRIRIRNRIGTRIQGGTRSFDRYQSCSCSCAKSSSHCRSWSLPGPNWSSYSRVDPKW
jgi:hypothetical protein